MVKLRVVVRIIPETEYLAALESTIAHLGPVRGEKKFHVIVQEPDKWYIGTLALAVKQKYENLYKHDLGQIKYLKNDEDDCDLDPEEGVAELLVNEGKALTDKSDQSVTIKVIREQGRAIRQGSVIPDLTPSHYQLPAKPPVPRFENVPPSPRKRHAESPLFDVQPAKRRRDRLAEIEEDEEVAPSIERDSMTNVVLQNPQPVHTNPVTGTLPDARGSNDEASWSFSQVGPPTFIEPILPNHTPVRNYGESVNLGSSRSPNGGNSSSRGRFLKPARDVFNYPESDIDDSQLSVASQQTSKIQPRLISRNINGISTEKGALASLVQDDSQSWDGSENQEASSGNHTAQTHGNPPSSHKLTKENAPMTDLPETPAATNGAVVANGQPLRAGKGTRISMNDSSTFASTSPAAATITQNMVDTINSMKPMNETIPSVRRSPTRTSGQQNQTTPSGMGDGSESTSLIAVPTESPNVPTPDGSHSRTESAQAKERGRPHKALNKLKSGPVKLRRLTTPAPDSPSEQLSQALEESARKSTSVHSNGTRPMTTSTHTSPRRAASSDESEDRANVTHTGNAGATLPSSGRLGLGITDSPRKAKAASQLVVPQSVQSPQTMSEETAITDAKTAESVKKAKRKRRSIKADGNDGNVHTDETPRKAVAKVSTERADSTISTATAARGRKSTSIASTSIDVPVSQQDQPRQSSATRVSTVILPAGMTREEYDRMVANNAHLNLEPKNKVTRRRSSLSLRKSISRTSEVSSNKSLGAEKEAELPKPAAAQKPLASQEKSSGSSISNDRRAGNSTIESDTSSAVGRSTSEVQPANTAISTTAQKVASGKLQEPRVPPKVTAKGEMLVTPMTKSKERSIASAELEASRGAQASTPSVSSKSGSTSKVTSSTPSKAPNPVSAPTAKAIPGNKTAANVNAADTSELPSTKVIVEDLQPNQQHQPTPQSGIKQAATTTDALAPIAQRPTLARPNSIYQARSLKELAMFSGSTSNSPLASAAASPATTTQHRTSFLGKSITGANKRRVLFDDPDESSDDSSEDSSSSEDSDGSDDSSSSSPSKKQKRTNHNISSGGSKGKAGKSTATTTTKTRNTPTSSSAAKAVRPDPTIRDTSLSVDDDSGSEAGSTSLS